MRRTIHAAILSMILAVLAGCNCYCCNQCHVPACSPCRCHPCQDGKGAGQQGPGGTGTVSYPYYTLRGPRDFLQTNPQSIGP